MGISAFVTPPMRLVLGRLDSLGMNISITPKLSPRGRQMCRLPTLCKSDSFQFVISHREKIMMVPKRGARIQPSAVAPKSPVAETASNSVVEVDLGDRKSVV